MGMMTDYLANALRNHIFRNTAYTSPATVYLALFTVTPTESTAGTEVTGGSYARQACAWSTTANPGEVSNTAAETFSAMPACTVVAMGVMDALTAGNLLTFGALPTPVAYTAGQNATWAIADILMLID